MLEELLREDYVTRRELRAGWRARDEEHAEERRRREEAARARRDWPMVFAAMVCAGSAIAQVVIR